MNVLSLVSELSCTCTVYHMLRSNRGKLLNINISIVNSSSSSDQVQGPIWSNLRTVLAPSTGSLTDMEVRPCRFTSRDCLYYSQKGG